MGPGRDENVFVVVGLLAGEVGVYGEILLSEF